MISSKHRLKFDSGGRYRIYSDANRTQEIISEQTEFTSDTETTVYLEGLSVSDSLGGEEVTLQAGLSGNWYATDSVNFTVVQAEFLIQIKAFIGYAWTKAETTHNPIDPVMFGKIAKGDDRDFLNVYSDTDNFDDAPFRLMQTAVLTPYRDLHSGVDLQSERLTQVALTSIHYNVDAIPETEAGQDYGMEDPVGIGASAEPDLRAELFEIPLRGSVASSNWVRLTLEADGIDGHIPFGVGWGINWRANVNMDCGDPLEPEVYISGTSAYVGVHDKYPFFEIICLTSDGDYTDIYRHTPAAHELPGPHSLSNANMIDFNVNKTVP